MSLSEEYNRKKKNSAGEVLQAIQDGDYVLSAQAMAEPVSLLEQMPFSSDSIHSKSGCSQVCILLL